MANANMIKFYRGLLANLPATGENGALYITTDEGSIYYGTGTGMKRLGDYIMVDAIENLPTDGANATSLYYCVKENVLCRYDSTKGWVQINKQPTAEEMKTLLGLGSMAYKSEVAEADLNEALAAKINASTAANHTHDNKDLLDTYTQTEADLADAVAKKHAHTFNETELNKIVEGDVAKWNGVAADHLTSADKTTLENSIKEAKKAGTDANTNIETYKVTNDARVLAVEEDVAEITNAENGILAQAKTYADGKDTAIAAAKKAGDDAQGAIDAYIESNNTALAGVKATAEAAAVKTEVETALSGKVDKVEGKSLISDSEIARLAGVTNYDDTTVKADIAKKADSATMTTELGKKVDKVDGYSMVSDTEIARLKDVDNYDDSALAGRVTTAEGKITALETESAKHALKTEVEAVDAKFADYVTSASYATDKQATTDALNARYTKTEADEKFAVKGEDSYDDTELAGRVSAIEADYLKAADKYNDTQVKADIKANADAIDAIEADYLKAADIANFETKENVKKVADDLSAYKISNDAAVALKADKSVVDAMYTNEQIDAAILVETNRAKGVEEGLQTQINTIMNNPDTEGVINSINEFTQYITDHGEIAEGFRTDIDANAKAIEDHEALAAQTYETKADAAQKLVDAKAYADEKIAAIPATSWNDLTNKPFYDTSIEPITWDGVVGDRVTGSIVTDHISTPLNYVKMSDVILTVEDLNTSTVTFSTGETYTGEGYADNFVCGLVMYGEGLLMSVPTTDFSDLPAGFSSISFPETGTYFLTNGNGYVTSVTFPGGELKTLDDKFVPNTIARVTDVEAAQSAAEAKAATAQAAAEAAQKTADGYATAHADDYDNTQIDEKVNTKLDANGWTTTETSLGKKSDNAEIKFNCNTGSSLLKLSAGDAMVNLGVIGGQTALEMASSSGVLAMASNAIMHGSKDNAYNLSFPEKTGTIALTSDVTDAVTTAGTTAQEKVDALANGQVKTNTEAIATKANAADVYAKTETFTKEEVNAAIAAAVETAHTWGEF